MLTPGFITGVTVGSQDLGSLPAVVTNVTYVFRLPATVPDTVTVTLRHF
jgi:hypothetical protein